MKSYKQQSYKVLTNSIYHSDNSNRAMSRMDTVEFDVKTAVYIYIHCVSEKNATTYVLLCMN